MAFNLARGDADDQKKSQNIPFQPRIQFFANQVQTVAHNPYTALRKSCDRQHFGQRAA